MRKLSLIPHDFLFLRDSRPMGGSATGHGARIPEPHVFHSALHAACHRAFADDPEVGYRHDYAEQVEAYRESYRVECRKAGVDYVPLDTHMQFDKALIGYLHSRRARF